MKRLAGMLLIMVFCLILSCALSELYIPRIDGLPSDFVLGMDVSSLLSLENSGVTYRDLDGRESDLLSILHGYGINTIRLRIWNDPYDSEGHGYGGGNCDVNTARILGHRATELGMSVMLDFHYSDFWADPSKQMAPKAWKNVRTTTKKKLIYEYTLSALQSFLDDGIRVSMVQLGNETNGAFCGERNWEVITALMKEAGRAVRETYPAALIAVHFANPEKSSTYLEWAEILAKYELDYDVFATSYYPWWHGTLDNLKAVLSTIQQKWNKKVLVAETSYAWTLEDGDFFSNTIGEGGAFEQPYPISLQGQTNAVADVISAVNDIGGLGVCYWEGGWIPVGTVSHSENSAKWETYGSGWASSYAAEYDPSDAGVYYGGSACDNQTFFDFHGNALPSIKVFQGVYSGTSQPVAIDTVENMEIFLDLGSDIQLPDTVNAIFTDNHREAVAVSWNTSADTPIDTSVPGDHVIHGTAMGLPVSCTLHMIQKNYLANPSFESPDDSMWKTENFGDTEQLYIEDKKTDSLSGTCHYHFYSSAASSVGFRLFQECSQLDSGTYRFQISLMGGDAGVYSAEAFAEINGILVQSVPLAITKWNEWDTGILNGISIQEGDLLTVGIKVVCDGAGAWGKIDDACLNRVQ